jgi:hypothetical protein
LHRWTDTPAALVQQNTVSRSGQDIVLLARGRHDPCVVPRAVPMVEAMVALVLADQLLQHYAQVCAGAGRQRGSSACICVRCGGESRGPPPLRPLSPLPRLLGPCIHACCPRLPVPCMYACCAVRAVAAGHRAGPRCQGDATVRAEIGGAHGVMSEGPECDV